jgi:hypothetical protein
MPDGIPPATFRLGGHGASPLLPRRNPMFQTSCLRMCTSDLTPYRLHFMRSSPHTVLPAHPRVRTCDGIRVWLRPCGWHSSPCSRIGDIIVGCPRAATGGTAAAPGSIHDARRQQWKVSPGSRRVSELRAQSLARVEFCRARSAFDAVRPASKADLLL